MNRYKILKYNQNKKETQMAAVPHAKLKSPKSDISGHHWISDSYNAETEAMQLALTKAG